MKKIAVIILLLSPLFSRATDFNTLLSNSFKRNREIQSNLKQIESSRFQLKSVRSLYLPDVELSYFKIDYDKQPLVSFPSIQGGVVHFPITDDNFSQFTATMNWLLFDFGGRNSAYKTARKGMLAALYQLNLAKRNVAINLLERYTQAIQLKRSIDVVDKTLDAVNTHLKNVYQFRKEGLVPKSDVLRLESLKMKLESEKTMLEGNFNTVLHDIERISGTEIKDNTLKPLPDIQLNIQGVIDKAIENREELKLILVKRDINLLKAKIERATNLPQLVAKVEYSDTTNNLNPVKSNTTYYLGVRIKLFDGMKSHYNRKSYLKLAEKNNDVFEDTKERIKIQIRNELTTLKSLEKQLDFYKKAFEASKENYRVVKLQFEEHIVSTVDLKDAISDLKESETYLYITQEKVKAQKLKILWLSKKIEEASYEK